MTIYELLNMIQTANKVEKSFNSLPAHYSLVVEIKRDPFGEFDNAGEFEIQVRAEFTKEFAYKILNAYLMRIYGNRYGCEYSYLVQDKDTGEILAQVYPNVY